MPWYGIVGSLNVESDFRLIIKEWWLYNNVNLHFMPLCLFTSELFFFDTFAISKKHPLSFFRSIEALKAQKQYWETYQCQRDFTAEISHRHFGFVHCIIAPPPLFLSHFFFFFPPHCSNVLDDCCLRAGERIRRYAESTGNINENDSRTHSIKFLSFRR